MKSIPLAICLFTSTKGHFGRTDRYLETVSHLNSLIPLHNFAQRYANIAVTSDYESGQIGDTIQAKLWGIDFVTNWALKGSWSHGQQSHQDGYLNDLHLTYHKRTVLAHQYCLHLEDDWKLYAYDGDLLRQFAIAIRILEENPEVMQVRFPRFADETERILRLQVKHGIDGLVERVDDTHFRTNDFSLNPSVFRTRDLKIATELFRRDGGRSLPLHVEHGFGHLLKHLSRERACLAVLNPANVKAAHIGTRPGEEDSVTEPVYAN